MKKQILVVGSLAFDQVMKYDGVFKNVMVPNNYSVAVTARDRAISFGGCGGNIAYNLRLLGQSPVLLTAVGSDFEKYMKRLNDLGVDTSGINVSDKFLTAACFIVTDKEQNQITIFDGAAMTEASGGKRVKDLDYGRFAYAIISPDKPERMMQAAHDCSDLGVPFIFDPAQQTNNFSGEDLKWALGACAVFVGNEYEAELLAKKIGLSVDEVENMAAVFVCTHGAKGVTVHSRKEGFSKVAAVKPFAALDPTGCGDAFRAGLLMGVTSGYSIKKACQIGALMATYNMEHAGTQNHAFTMEEFNERLEENFGEKIE